MENKYIISALTFFPIIFITLVNLFMVSGTSLSDNRKSFRAYLVTFTMLLLSSAALIFFIPQDDFIYDLNIIELITAAGFSLIIFLLYSFEATKKFAVISTIIGSIALYFFIPNDYNLFTSPDMLLWSKVIMVLSLFSLSFVYKYINGLEGILPLQTFFIGLGIFILSLFGATPQLLGLIGLAIAAIYMAFYTFNADPSKLSLNEAAANSLGFTIGWLLIRSGEESSISCSLLLSVYFVVEGATALLKKATMMKQYEYVYENTSAYTAHSKGLPTKTVNTSILKILMLLSLFGCLQIYAPNSFSLIIFATVVMLWFLYRLRNWETPNETLAEINKNFIKEVKENISDAQKLINRGKDDI